MKAVWRWKLNPIKLLLNSILFSSTFLFSACPLWPAACCTTNSTLPVRMMAITSWAPSAESYPAMNRRRSNRQRSGCISQRCCIWPHGFTSFRSSSQSPWAGLTLYQARDRWVFRCKHFGHQPAVASMNSQWRWQLWRGCMHSSGIQLKSLTHTQYISQR